MDLYISVFVYVGSIVLYKRIVNANTQSIRIANADGQGELYLLFFNGLDKLIHKLPRPFAFVTRRIEYKHL